MQETRTPASTEASERIEVAKAILDEHATMAIAAALEGEPWIATVFFIEDEPRQGRLDMCCALVLSERKRSLLEQDPRIAFVVAGDAADRWLHGSGTIELLTDDSGTLIGRLERKAPQAGPFLRSTGCVPARIHVGQMTLTDLGATPPVAEFTFE